MVSLDNQTTSCTQRVKEIAAVNDMSKELVAALL